MSEVVRSFGASDLARALTLNNEFAKELSWLDLERLGQMIETATYARVVGPVDAFLIAYDQDAPYGGVNFAWFKARHDRFIYVDRIVVAAAARGRGLGRRLYEDLFGFAVAQGQHLICAEINADPPNPASDAFHQRLGFETLDTVFQPKIGKRVRYVSKTLAR